MSTEWKFPELAVGDDVLMSRDPTRSDMTYAKVTNVKPNAKAIDVVAFIAGRPVMFEHLWHKDDPRIAKEADRFTNSCSGVFICSEAVTTRIGLLARMDALEKRFANLERYVSGDTLPESPAPLEEQPNETMPAVEKRPRGRPRRIPLTAEAVL